MQTAYAHIQQTIQTLVEEASARERYWTIPGHRWEACALEAERADVMLLDVLDTMGLQSLDRGQDGSVHLG